jgi:hypothetical protein
MMPNQDNFRAILAIIIVLLVMSYVAALFLFEIPEAAKDLINIAGGAVISMCTTVVQFFFGSSQGSKNSGDALAKIATERKENV